MILLLQKNERKNEIKNFFWNDFFKCKSKFHCFAYIFIVEMIVVNLMNLEFDI